LNEVCLFDFLNLKKDFEGGRTKIEKVYFFYKGRIKNFCNFPPVEFLRNLYFCSFPPTRFAKIFLTAPVEFFFITLKLYDFV
jgi:hypothetical protein